MALDDMQHMIYRHAGHLTIRDVFAPDRMDAAVADIMAWSQEFIDGLGAEERAWYVDGGVSDADVLRKLDNPHIERPFFGELAREPKLVELVEGFIGPGVSVYFSQIFFKPPRGGGPKPVHQDNYYFGPNDLEGIVTAWVALDDATLGERVSVFRRRLQHGAGVSPRRACGRALQPPGAGRDRGASAHVARSGLQGRRVLPPRQHVPSLLGQSVRPVASGLRVSFRAQ